MVVWAYWREGYRPDGFEPGSYWEEGYWDISRISFSWSGFLPSSGKESDTETEERDRHSHTKVGLIPQS